MTSIIKVDQIQTAAGGVPTAGDLGVNVTTADMPSGGVLQVANVYSTNSIAVTSTARLSLDSYTFTPLRSGSKFVITFFLQANWGNLNHGFGAFMYKDGVEIAASGNSHSVYLNTVADAYTGGSWSFINSGSTAGTPIVFELRAQPYRSDTIRFTHAGQSRGFTIMEVAG
jgi:hypothetical protein